MVSSDCEPVRLPRERRLKLLALICIVYFTTCGGPFGLEPLVGAVGPGWTVVLLVVMPLVWSAPLALMVAELATRMPDEGGYYVWVKRTMGPFWGVQEAWWTMGYSIALLAIFPVLFVSYLDFLIPGFGLSADPAHAARGAAIRWLAAVAVIVSATAVNLRGAKNVGRWAKFGAAFVTGAFATMVLAWVHRGPPMSGVTHLVRSDLAGNHRGALLLGLSVIVFNFSGWDNVSTYAAEVDEPQRNYPRAVLGALAIVVLSYLLPVIAGLSVTTDPANWTAEAGWPVIASLIGGRWLGTLISVAGLVSMWELFGAQLLYVSRLPYVLALDAWLPRTFANFSTGAGAPRTAILWLCGLTALFAGFSFGGLAVIQGVLYTGALTLELIALILVRKKKVSAPGCFLVPGGRWGLAYVCVAPMIVAAGVLAATLRDGGSYPNQLLVVGGVAASGIAIYLLRRRGAARLTAERGDERRADSEKNAARENA
ncbi:MAG: APC family permease [Candidatus Acidiferrales bacterium]